MARTAVTLTALTPNAGVAVPATTAVDPTNGHVITGCPLDQLFLVVANTAGGAKNVTVKAGTNPPALEAGQGDLVVSVAATSGVKWIGPFTSGRFQAADGLHVDLEAGITGTITAVQVPRTA